MKHISSIGSIWQGLDLSYLLTILLSLIPSLLCITLHEISHGYTAYLLGDTTAKERGRLSLNPIKHIDLTGLIMMVLFRVGWAKPVPVNMYKFRDPKRGMALTAIAGPLSNLIIAVVFMFLFGATYIPLSNTGVGSYFSEMIQLTAVISIGLGLFNLIPVPPLDGSKVLFSLIKDEHYYKLMRYERYGSIIMIVLVASGILGKPLGSAINWVYNALIPVAEFGLELALKMIAK